MREWRETHWRTGGHRPTDSLRCQKCHAQAAKAGKDALHARQYRQKIMPLRNACPVCVAAAGDPCVTATDGSSAPIPHLARQQLIVKEA